MVTGGKKSLVERVRGAFRFASNGNSGMGGDASDPLTELLGSGYGNQGGGASNQAPKPRPGFIDNYFIHKTPVGSMGTESYAGYPREEYLHELFGKDRAKIFDKMRRSDTQIKMLLGAVKNTIKAAVWEIEPATDQPDDVRRADVIRHILFDDYGTSYEGGAIKPGGFKKFLGEYLSVCDFGHVVFEKTFKLVKNHPRFGFYHGIAGLDHVNPKTIYRFNLTPMGGLKSVTQLAVGDLHRYINLPAQFLMHAALEQEGANYEGISLLRPCYGSWLRKNLMLKLNAIGVEKYAIPTPVASIPDGYQSQPGFSFLVQVLEAFTSGEAAYLTIPEKVKLEMPKNQFDPEKVDKAIEAEELRMSKAFLANFLELGIRSSSSFAMSENLSSFFLCGIEHIAHTMCEMVNAQLIPDLCNLNFGPLPQMPKLKVSGISDKAGKELAEAASALVTSGIIEADDPLEEQIRKRYGFTKKSDVGKRPAGKAGGGDGGGFSGGGGMGGGNAAALLSERLSVREKIMRRLYG